MNVKLKVEEIAFNHSLDCHQLLTDQLTNPQAMYPTHNLTYYVGSARVWSYCGKSFLNALVCVLVVLLLLGTK